MKIAQPASLAFLAAIELTAPVWAAGGTPSVSISAPAMGGVPITSRDIPVAVEAKNFAIGCKNVGQSAKAGRGHYHVMIDGMTMAQMTNLYCSDKFSISGAGLKAGEHTLAVVLATDDHADIGKPAMVKFDYQPATVQPLPEAKNTKPVVSILSPRAGAVVGRKLNLEVAVSGLDLSCDLEGKPNVAGYGHLHVFVSQAADMMAKPHAAMAMPSMAMPGMIGMPCTKTVPVDLSAWKSGKTKLMVMLANNDHMPTAGGVPAIVDVIVK